VSIYDEPDCQLDLSSIQRLLQQGGPFDQLLPGFESREQQLQMLADVVRGYNQGEINLIESGTGTGKSLAYLIPAVLWALKNGQRTLISTKTINLQEQLIYKDSPLQLRSNTKYYAQYSPCVPICMMRLVIP